MISIFFVINNVVTKKVVAIKKMLISVFNDSISLNKFVAHSNKFSSCIINPIKVI